MRDEKNLGGKLVCRIDEAANTVEIVHKGFKTLIYWKTDGSIEIVNT
jgi:hypothetical protein